MKKVAAIAAVVAISACTGSDSEVSDQLARQFVKGVDPIDISQVGPASWERVCVLPPYSTNKYAAQVLGFKWNAEGNTSIASSDAINVLVFVREASVVAYVEHPRNFGDFSELKPSCLARASARVVRRVGPSGWVHLVAQNAA